MNNNIKKIRNIKFVETDKNICNMDGHEKRNLWTLQQLLKGNKQKAKTVPLTIENEFNKHSVEATKNYNYYISKLNESVIKNSEMKINLFVFNTSDRN